MEYFNQNRIKVQWPDDWPQPTLGADASPLLGKDQFEALKADIKRHGLYERIQFTPEGKIAKGRNRYRALRELDWTHERILADASITVKSTNTTDAMSNILRVHRTKRALVASYLIAHPKELKALFDQRKRQSASGCGPARSGCSANIAATVGCNPTLVTRTLDELVDYKQHAANANDFEYALTRMAADEWCSADYPVSERKVYESATLGRISSTTSTGAVGEITNDEREGVSIESGNVAPLKTDHRKLTAEKKQAIKETLACGTPIKQTAKTHGVSKNTVKTLRNAASKPANAPSKTTSESDPIATQLQSMWKKYRNKTVTPDLFRAFISDSISVPGSVSIVKDALENLKLQ